MTTFLKQHSSAEPLHHLLKPIRFPLGFHQCVDPREFGTLSFGKVLLIACYTIILKCLLCPSSGAALSRGTYQEVGCPKTLASLIRDGQYDPQTASSDTLREMMICGKVGIPVTANITKV